MKILFIFVFLLLPLFTIVAQERIRIGPGVSGSPTIDFSLKPKPGAEPCENVMPGYTNMQTGEWIEGSPNKIFPKNFPPDIPQPSSSWKVVEITCNYGGYRQEGRIADQFIVKWAGKKSGIPGGSAVSYYKGLAQEKGWTMENEWAGGFRAVREGGNKSLYVTLSCRKEEEQQKVLPGSDICLFVDAKNWK